MQEFLQMATPSDTSIGCANLTPETDNFSGNDSAPDMPTWHLQYIMDTFTRQTPYTCIGLYSTMHGKYNLIPMAQ